MKRFILLLVAFWGSCLSLEAREVIKLDDNWRFYFSLENSADYARTISLPHTWAYNSNNSLIATQPTTANYLREIYVPRDWAEKRLFIKFYGVESVADVMVNGKYVGEHRGGATAFTFEITDKVNVGASNRLHVIVNDAPQSDILPTSHEENRYGGIYRPVELIVTDKLSISPLFYGSDGLFVDARVADSSTAEGDVKVHLNSTAKSANAVVTLSIFDMEGNEVFRNEEPRVKISSATPALIPYLVNSPELWSPSSPNLYDFVIEVSDGDYSDRVVVRSGFRTIDYNSKGAIKINGEPLPQRGVELYHDYPHVGGAASKEDIERDFEIIEEIGANAIRSVTHPHHPYLYELSDKNGKMVWIDFPLCKAPYLSDVAYYPTKRFHENGREMLREIIYQNYNHPSVVMWGIFSLLSPRGDSVVPFVEELNSLAKEIDPSRPTVAVSDQDGKFNSVTDLIVWRQSMGWDRGTYPDVDLWRNQLHTRWGSMRSGVSWGQSGRFDQQAEESAYKIEDKTKSAAWYPEGRARIFHEEYAKRVMQDSLFWGGYINSMFDFKSSRSALGENNNGVMSFDRRKRKDIFYLYKAAWNREEPLLHIADSRNKIHSDSLYRVSVYATDTLPPTLYYGGDTIKMRREAPWHFTLDSLPLKKGTNKIVVKQGSLADSVQLIYKGASASSSLRSSRRSR